MDFGMLSFGLEHFLIKINWPKIGIFLGLGFSSTFGPPPPPYFSGSPDPGVKCLGHRHKKVA